MGLTGKSAIVTGAGNGIGKAIAQRLAREGASVLVNDLVAEDAKAIAAGLESEGLSATSFAADISDEGAVRAMVEHARSQWDKIDILVNNAGFIQPSAIVDMLLEEWERVFAVNARGVFLCSRAVLPGMMERRSGRIITIASVAAHITRPKLASYCASKAAATQFTKVLAFEAAPYGITANIVCPGSTMTAMVEDNLAKDPITKEKWRSSVLMGEFAQEEDHAEIVLFLASDRSQHITGQVISVDGGQSLNWVHGIQM